MIYYTDEFAPDNSTAVEQVLFNENTNQLTVFPTSGHYGYQYDNVPVEVFDEFKNAPSAGRYFREVSHKFGPSVTRPNAQELCEPVDVVSDDAPTFPLNDKAEEVHDIEVFFTIGSDSEEKSYVVEAPEVDAAVLSVTSVAESFGIDVTITRATVYFD